MKAKSYSKGKKAQCEARTPAAPQRFVDRNLAGVNPMKEQFEPTDAMPVKQHFKMAGGA